MIQRGSIDFEYDPGSDEIKMTVTAGRASFPTAIGVISSLSGRDGQASPYAELEPEAFSLPSAEESPWTEEQEALTLAKHIVEVATESPYADDFKRRLQSRTGNGREIEVSKQPAPQPITYQRPVPTDRELWLRQQAKREQEIQQQQHDEYLKSVGYTGIQLFDLLFVWPVKQWFGINHKIFTPLCALALNAISGILIWQYALPFLADKIVSAPQQEELEPLTSNRSPPQT